ncbi:alpha/beta hydrolase [Fulvivirgaceae bacterium LMO-SS25]
MNAGGLKAYLWLLKWVSIFKKEDYLNSRKKLQTVASRFSVPDEVTLYNFAANGVKCERAVPNNLQEGKIIIYFHGGAYVAGSAQTHRHLTAKIALESECEVITVDYKLAPEFPFPHALDDALNAIDGCRLKYPNAKIFLAGDSAGGGLALAASLKLKEENNQVQGLILLAPWVDLTCDGAVYQKANFKDPILSAKRLKTSAALYQGTVSNKNPYISPLFADLSGLPPAFIQAGSADLLFDENKLLVEKLNSAGVNIEFDPWNGMPHVFQFFWPILPSAEFAIQKISMWIKNQ